MSRPNYYRELYNKLFGELKKLFGGKCKNCGTEEKLEFAHVKPTDLNGMGRGKITRYYDIKNYPDCYTLLCDKCHKLFDSLSSEIKEEWLTKNRKV